MNFHAILSVVVEFSSCGQTKRQTDGHDKASIVAFRDCVVKAP
jgi:hypothetical protein